MRVQKIVSLEESTFELQHKTKCENFSTECFFLLDLVLQNQK